MTTAATRAYRHDLANRHCLEHVMARRADFQEATGKHDIEAASVAFSPFALAASMTRNAVKTRSPLAQVLESIDTGPILPPTHPSVQARAKQLNAALALLAPFAEGAEVESDGDIDATEEGVSES